MRDYHVYDLEIVDGKIKNKYFQNEISNFVAPSTKPGPKLYCVVDNEGNIHYIGQTKRSLAARMRSGFSPKSGSGYHGYKWRHNDGLYKLIVWFMSLEDHIETVEAEIVYLIRDRLGNWPLSQNEIHFFQSNQEQRELSEVLYENILEEKEKCKSF